MTFNDLIAELHVSKKDMQAWLKENNAVREMLFSHELNAAPDELSSDGETYIRNVHLEHTHPEIQERINNLVQVIFDMRKDNNELRAQLKIQQSKVSDS